MENESIPRLRLFVAVELPPAWQEALAEQQAQLRARLGEAAQALRWVRQGGFHITLVFLGPTPSTEVPGIRAAMAAAASGAAPFGLRLGVLGTFGGRRTRVVWSGLEGDLAAMAALHRRLAAGLRVTGPEADRLSPHITLARVVDRTGPNARSADAGAALAASLIHVPAARVPPLEVRSISLMQSELQRGRAVYYCRLAVPLAGD